MKFKSWKRVFSGILAAVTVISSCTAGPVMAASEETETGYPTLQEVIEQLDEDEIVRPSDYIVPVGSDFNIKVDFSNLDVPDWSKVVIYFDDAYNTNGEFFTTDHADSYHAVYHVEPVSGHPVYQISRNVRVKETEKPKENATDNSSVSSSSNGGGTSSASVGAENEAEDDSSGDDSQSNSSAAGNQDPGTDSVKSDESEDGSPSASSGESASSGTDSGSGSSVNDSEPASSGDGSGSDKADDTSDDTANTGTDSSVATTESNPAESDNETDPATDSMAPDTDSTIKTDDESSVSDIETNTADEKQEPTEEKTSLLTTILSGIASLFKSDEIVIPEANIYRVLQNPIYIGMLTYHKQYVPDYLEQKKVLNHGEMEVLQVRGRHEPIISDEQFERVQQIIAKGREDREKLAASGSKAFARRKSNDIWVNKMQCECGKNFNRKGMSKTEDGQTECIYMCHGQVCTGTAAARAKKGLGTESICKVPIIPSWKLQMMAYEVFHVCLQDVDTVLELAQGMLEKHINDRAGRKGSPTSVTSRSFL